MCIECGAYPCLNMCPNNTEELKPTCFCNECGKSIYADEQYYEIDKMVCCADCLCEIEGFFEEGDELPECESCGRKINFEEESVFRTNTGFYCEDCVEKSYTIAKYPED